MANRVATTIAMPICSRMSMCMFGRYSCFWSLVSVKLFAARRECNSTSVRNITAPIVMAPTSQCAGASEERFSKKTIVMELLLKNYFARAEQPSGLVLFWRQQRAASGACDGVFQLVGRNGLLQAAGGAFALERTLHGGSTGGKEMEHGNPHSSVVDDKRSATRPERRAGS